LSLLTVLSTVSPRWGQNLNRDFQLWGRKRASFGAVSIVESEKFATHRVARHQHAAENQQSRKPASAPSSSGNPNTIAGEMHWSGPVTAPRNMKWSAGHANGTSSRQRGCVAVQLSETIQIDFTAESRSSHTVVEFAVKEALYDNDGKRATVQCAFNRPQRMIQ
jgi:hypothetical protein